MAIVTTQFVQSYYILKRYVAGKKYKEVNLEGKVFIVTGCNTGIGFETAKALAKMHATVVMACRSPDKANEARAKILKEINCPASKVYKKNFFTFR